jgi:transglutaminase-like putative cysteine protease
VAWRLEVSHTTGYKYPKHVVSSYNEARVTPLSTESQMTIEAHFDVQPPVRPSRYWDYWGTLVHAFDVHVPHEELVVTATSLVETGTGLGARDDREISWSALGDAAVTDKHYEYLVATESTVVDDELTDIATSFRSANDEPDDAAGDAIAWLRDQLEYQPGSTSVSTSALEAWKVRRGVCQDYAHLAIGVLRAMGIPARYVSGYFHPDDDAEIGDVVTGQSHAWAEMWLGDWVPFDPTNAVPVGERHVVVARGRDYRDVAPLKGVYTGAPSSLSTVAVTVTRRA